MCWAARPQANAEQVPAFENEVGNLFAEGRLTTVCEYDPESFDPVTLAYAARVHPRTVAAAVYHEDPVRIDTGPQGTTITAAILLP